MTSVASASVAPSAGAPNIDTQVWRVTASNAVAVGSLYVFLPDGKLLMASSGSTPAMGSWKRRSEGGITMVEDSQSYRVDVLEAGPQRLRLRSHNPGTPVDMTLTPVPRADTPVPAAFVGEWNAKVQECGRAGSETRLRIDADRIRLLESGGQVLAVLASGPDDVGLVARVAGEGQERLLYRRYRLAGGGKRLVDATDGDKGGLARVRCG